MNDVSLNYKVYTFNAKEKVVYGLCGIIYFFVMGMIFYQHMVFASIACIGGLIYLKEKNRRLQRQRQHDLRDQFKEGMYTLSSALVSGRSLEQAFIVSLNDLKIIYQEEDYIVKEWTLIVKKIQMNETVASALLDFAERADMEEIYNFAQIFVLAKKSGGDLISIIRDTTRMINEKLEVQKEIDVLIAQKKYEQKILSYIVPAMIVFFSLSSPDFLEPLYSTILGRIIMTFALALYLISGYIGKKIVEIEV